MGIRDGYFLLSKYPKSTTEATMELHHVQPTTAFIAPGATPPMGQYDTAKFINLGAKTRTWFANATGVLVARSGKGISFSAAVQLHGEPTTLYYVAENGKVIFSPISIIYPGSPEVALAAPGSMAALYLTGGGPPGEPMMSVWQPTDPKDPNLMVWSQVSPVPPVATYRPEALLAAISSCD